MAKFCGKCGVEISSAEKFCWECGSVLKEDSCANSTQESSKISIAKLEHQNANPIHQNKKSMLKKIMIAVLCLSAAGYLFWHDYQKAAQEMTLKTEAVEASAQEPNHTEMTALKKEGVINGVTEKAKQQAEKNKIINISGNWFWDNGTSNLRVSLNMDGNNITGSHKSDHNEGRRLDYGDDSITGSMAEPNVFNVTIKSGYGRNAFMTGIIHVIDSNAIEWKAINTVGEVYIPKYCILRR